MPLLVTADLHFTDNPRDEHRFDLFEFLGDYAFKHKVDAILLLGDITDAKDKHSSALVNTLVYGLTALATNTKVYVLRGNHDYIEEDEPFFDFINNIDGLEFITSPKRVTLGSQGRFNSLLLPNVRDPQVWTGLDFDEGDLIFCHQTFDGAITENGFRLEGFAPSIFGKIKAKVYSGDIHVPQIVSRKPYIEYVGAPYRVRFGDSFDPRVLLINDDGSTTDLKFKTKSKHLIEIDGDVHGAGVMLGFPDIRPKDQVKVRVKLSRSTYPEWPALRAAIIEQAKELRWELTGPELIAAEERPERGIPELPAGALKAFAPEEALAAYAKSKGLDGDLLAAGKVWLDKAIGGRE